MLPENLKEFGETLISIICLSSNIYFWWKDDGYFNDLTELNPLVHTWSLAVEEQFYFIFPILCYLFLRKKFYLIILLICSAVVSLFLSQWGGNFQYMLIKEFQMFSQYRYASFYLPIGRIWELLFGAFIAFYLQDNDTNKGGGLALIKFSRKSNELFSLFGLLLIVISVLFFDNHNIPPFPNCYTLIPTCGATLIILFANKNTLVGYVLSTRPLRWIGLLSYSAYLWHQPLLAFTRLQSNQTLNIIIVVSSIFPLSIFSYFFIEQPFRNKKYFSRQKIFLMSGLAFVITLFIAIFLIQTANNRSMIVNKSNDTYLSDLKKYDNWQYVVRNFNALERKSKTFSNRTITLNKRVVLIGDSFAQDFYNVIIEGKHLIDYEIRVAFVYSRCQIYLGLEDRRKFIEVKHRQTCTNANDIKYALPLIRVIKQYQYPRIEIVNVNNLLEKSLDKSIFVNIIEMICNGFNKTCPLFTRDGKLISHDGAHLTKYGARYVGDIISKNEPLNKV
ncbi:unnamed protein product [Adineta steineri]|uniref:Acyltransferase 3 domain-containing protein n=1 Tax=Adineta steineri TaxID=433720 RepID=A0A814VBF9_9BILA|nr:unnamed protein product [Adineta steineri]CAF1602186.1 unnamed protein product [Adineta steineri]